MTVIPLGELFVAGGEPAAPVAIRDGEALTLARFAADVGHAAHAVRAIGATRGAVLSTDPYRFLVALFGLWHAGATPIIPPNGLTATLIAARDAFDVVLADERPGTSLPWLPIEERCAATAPVDGLDVEVVSVAFFTSGSSGAPKRIVKPLALLDREIATLDAVWGHSVGRGPVLSTVPVRHVFGLTFHLLWPLASRRPFVSHVDEIWESLLARDVRDATLVTSPAHLTRLSGVAPLPRGRTPARVFTAGAPLRADEARAAADILGSLPTEIFGSTETGAIATRVQHGSAEPWMPLPGIQVTTDEAGRMIVHSPFAPGGEFASADRIEPMPDRGFHFLGRDDRIAKIGGVRVSLPKLEAELLALPWVADAAAAVLGNPPERLAAVVVPRGEGRSRLRNLGSFRFSRELRRQLATRLEPAWLPKSWRFVDELPRGDMGKRRDADVRALFAPRPGAST